MFEDGHAVGLHWHSRRLMASSPESLARTIAAAADRVERMAGGRPCRAFRPHGGGRSGNMYAGLARMEYALVGWGFNLWDFDWLRRRDPARIAQRIARKAPPGGIVVIHDGHHENPRADRRYAIETVRLLVPRLRERGFSFAAICGPDGGVSAAP